VSRGAEDLKDNIKDAGSKLQSDSDSASKDLHNKADNAADDSEGMLKKVRASDRMSSTSVVIHNL
jgi:hypothetical protein